MDYLEDALDEDDQDVVGKQSVPSIQRTNKVMILSPFLTFTTCYIYILLNVD